MVVAPEMARPRNAVGMLKDVPPAEMEGLLLADMQVSEDAVRQLALQRSVAVRDYLAAQSVPLERLFLGAAGGQLLWPRQVVVQQVDANDHDPETVTMPHVLGLPEQDARAAIADAGYTQTITTTQRAAAGDPGSVLRQTPAPQAVIDSSTAIELVVSTPAAMPDLVASTQQLAQAEVERLGGAAQFVTVVDASHSPGTILSTEPSAGEAMPQIVLLRVASGGVAGRFWWRPRPIWHVKVGRNRQVTFTATRR